MNDSQPDDLIAAAYDTNLWKRCGHLLTDAMGAHLNRVQHASGPVQRWCQPDENLAIAADFMDQQSAQPTSGTDRELEKLAAQFADLVETSLRRGQNLHHPNYIGHQVPASTPMAGLFDAVTTITNQVQGVYEMGPWGVAVERAVLAKVGATIGFPSGDFGGLVTSGGSLANLTALLAARNLRCPDFWSKGASSERKSPVLVVHGEAHYCVDRAAGVMGIGTDHIVRVPTDSERRMDASELQKILIDLHRQDIPVIAVVAVACTTPTGAFDPLEAIAKICRKHEVWLHVDAAHGGALCFSSKHRHLVAGLHLADSVVVDAHKMMFLPAVCAMVFYKNKEHRFAAFQQSAPYLFDPSAPDMSEFDNAVVTFECTKRAAALGLWGVWSLFGPDLFEALIDRVIEVAQFFYKKLLVDDSLQPFASPTCNIVVFRYCPVEIRDCDSESVDMLQLRIRRKLLEQGTAYITQTRLENRIYLRATIMNPLTSEMDIERIMTSIDQAGRQLISQMDCFQDQQVHRQSEQP